MNTNLNFFWIIYFICVCRVRGFTYCKFFVFVFESGPCPKIHDPKLKERWLSEHLIQRIIFHSGNVIWGFTLCFLQSFHVHSVLMQSKGGHLCLLVYCLVMILLKATHHFVKLSTLNSQYLQLMIIFLLML